MRLFLAAFCLSGIITASSAFAGNDEPLTGGSASPGHARFEVSPAQEFLTARARADSMHRDAILRHYDWVGYNFARPNVSTDPFFNAVVPARTRRIYSSPGYWSDFRGYAY